VATDLAGYGARPWQVGLTALPLSRALARLAEKGGDVPPEPVVSPPAPAARRRPFPPAGPAPG